MARDGRHQDDGRTGAPDTPGHSQGRPGLAPTRDGRHLNYQHREPVPAPGVRPPVTVVFEGGLAAGRSYWAAVQGALGDAAPTVVYDRAGLGRSAPAPGSRRLAALARDLVDLLGHLEGLGHGPFLLVGHSWGGPVVRLASAERPESIAGLVLVDPADESCPVLLSPGMLRQERIGQRLSMLLARLRLLGFAYRALHAALPPDAAADMRAEGYTVRAMRTRGRELDDTQGDLRELLAAPPAQDGVPLTVVSAGRTSPGMGRSVRTAATASHAYRAGLTAGGRHVILPEADHMVPTTAPEALAQEIRALL